jgi:dipeptidyl aminopeptidase/acylaminoacyl peptidase
MKLKILIAMATIFSASVGFCAASFAKDNSDKNFIQLKDYLDFERVGNGQISPDGSQILYSRSHIDKMNDKFTSTLWLMSFNGSRNRPMMLGQNALWAPDGKRIAYVASDNNEKGQIFVRFIDAESATLQVTSFEHSPRSMAWSPDGKQIAFVARVPIKSTWTVTLPERPQGAKWTEDPPVIDTLHYRQDRVGYTNNGYDHIFVVPAMGGTPRQLTSGDWNVGRRGLGSIASAPALSWSPDGKVIAFDGLTRAQTPEAWSESHINLVSVADGTITQLTSGQGNYGQPDFSPDGKQIAYTGYPEHNTSYPVPDLFVMTNDGSNIKALTNDLDDGPSSIEWLDSGREIVFTVSARGSRNIHAVDLRGRIRDITSGAQVVTLFNVSKNGRAAVSISTSDKPSEIAVTNIKGKNDISRLTDVNSDVLYGKTLGEVKEIWYDATAETGESARVQGWVVLPPNYDSNKKYPLLLQIHGGPHAMYNSGFNFTFQEFAARGYVVLYTNPRGSTGYGSDFANAIRHRYPGPVDYADLMAGVDKVIADGYADSDRMFVAGCSGGGILTTWIIGQTDRFKAAAALCPVTNWIGMSGTTDVVGWLYNFFPAPYWEDPKPWLDHSTLMHVGKVKTPTLLMTGDKDLRTPIGEAESYFAALKILGIPTRLIPMRNEYHGTGSIPSNYMRTNLMLRKWFDEFDPVKVAATTEVKAKH